jgi:hypothetical protein
MNVTIWYITEPYFAMIKINKLAEKFGDNYPKYSMIDGKSGITHLFCIDSKIDVRTICNFYKYEIYTDPYQMNIEPEQYSNDYIIKPDYTSNGDCYKLEKNFLI